MNLEPEIQSFIAQSDKLYQTSVSASVEDQRRIYDTVCKVFTPPYPPSLQTSDQTIASKGNEIPIRRYWRNDRSDACIVYFHGGGFVVGGLHSHDFICARLANDTRCKVIAVDYRLAPEHPFPAPFDDCMSVLSALQNRADEFEISAEKIILCGDSAGGNLSAAVALANRDKDGIPLLGQIMIYPRLVYDYTLPSYSECANAPLLSTEDVRYYHRTYTGGEDIHSPYLAPALAESFTGLPPALLLPVEYDPIRDDSFLYHEKLLEAGVQSELHLRKGLVHGCLRAIDTSPGVQLMYKKILAFIEKVQEPPSP